MMFPLWSRITSRFTDSTSNDGGGETLSVGEVDEVLSLVDSGDPLPVQDATKTTIGMTQRGALRHIEHQPTGAELTLTGGALPAAFLTPRKSVRSNFDTNGDVTGSPSSPLPSEQR